MKTLALNLRHTATALLLLLVSFASFADISAPALELQQHWDQANFASADKKQKAKALESLSEKARAAAAEHSSDADVQTWTGIILSTYAGEAGMSALGLVKEAKKYFEKSIELNSNALAGSAYTSLGSLYYQVPGWPIGFGDNDKAEEFLKKGLAMDPEGIDANYFYADFLMSQSHYAQAAAHFEKVLAAAPRTGRDLADQGRKAQATEALEKVRKKLH